MAEFPTAVSPPGGASYAPPLMSFGQFANWAADDPYDQKLKAAHLQQIQQQIDLSKAFAGGLPTDQNGQIDYRAAAGILAAKGDIGGAVSLLQQQPAPLSPMFGGGQPQGSGQPQQGGPSAPPSAPAAPGSVQAKPLPPPSKNSPQGDSGNNTITSLVTDKLPSQNTTTGQTVMKIAEVMGLDPNADLTPGQVRRAQGLLAKYAPEVAGVSVGSQGGGGTLPPSANAVSPRPPSAGGAGGAAQGAGAPSVGAAGAPAPVPSGGAVPAAAPAPQQQPLAPQEPLPPGFNDPVQAIKALRLNAAQLAGDPRRGAKEQATAMSEWADRIEASIKPVPVNASTTLLDPRTGKPIYQGPAAAAYGAGGGETGATLDADAENYRQTGKLPPNMGRGIQGATQATRIRERAAELEAESGGDTADWPTRWQTFGAQAAGQKLLQTRATNLKLAENEATTLIPRVRDISAKVSRTQYPTLNSLILAAEKGTGGTDVIKLGIAVASLVPVYARVLKPTGQITVDDTKHAHELLDKAWSDGQIGGALDQMEVELGAAKEALQKTMDEASRSSKKSSEGGSRDTKSDAGAGWVKYPQGTIREIK